MFKVGQTVVCVNSHGANTLTQDGKYLVSDYNEWRGVLVANNNGVKNWYSPSRFKAQESTPTPVVSSFEDRFVDELTTRLETIAEDNDYREEYQLQDDSDGGILIDFAYNLGYDVDLETSKVIIRLIKRK